ncbi:hypothetical protein HY630_01685 [Candidatus Uhrbacteria bacterium]|nr:hypothetical protein [Candidatus Uhrbacteria bacterium]
MNHYPRWDDRLAETVFWIVFVVFAAVMIFLALTVVARAQEADEPDSRARHMAHYARLQTWERAYARPRTMALWREVSERPLDSFRGERARIAHIISLQPALRELRALTQDREEAVLSGFCSQQDAGESTVREVLSELATVSIRLAESAQRLQEARSEDRLWGRKRGFYRAAFIEKFAKETERFERQRDYAAVVVDAMYHSLRFTNRDDPACAALYAGADWAAHPSWYFYEPTLGWPLEP